MVILNILANFQITSKASHLNLGFLKGVKVNDPAAIGNARDPQIIVSSVV